MTVEILTPDVVLYEGDATYLGLPGSDGSLGILNHHAPLVTTLREGEVVVKNDKDEQTFAVKGGTVEVLNNHVTILAQ
tara:strand:+ start:92 stop:325 length:234 start_codon:yes stop_codon:yes gene_type:complete